jgi:hypothetical protein
VGEERRARPARRVWLAAFLPLLVAAAPAWGQVVPDTIPTTPDTLPDPVVVPIPPEQVGGDTIPEVLRQEAESVAPVPAIPAFPTSPRAGWDVARWEWGPAELARLPGMTLLEFVERLPGMAVFRAGGFGRPTGITAMGAGGGRLRLFIDGFELDPHDAGSFPLETVSLMDLHRVRVQRSLAEIRVEVETFLLTEPEPYSAVELGTGAAQTRVLRALFSRGFGERAVGTGVFDLASTGGIGIREDYRHLNGIVRWSQLIGDGAGLQLEWRRTSVDREEPVYPLVSGRDDLVLRVRSRIGERGVVEAFAGRSRSGERDDEPAAMPVPHISATQVGLRSAYATERFFAESELRGRFGARDTRSAPAAAVDGRVAYRPLEALRAEADFRLARGDDENASALRVTGSAFPIPGFTLFASAEIGSSLVPILVTIPPAEEDSVPAVGFRQLRTDAAGVRLGAEFARQFGIVGFAGFRTAVDPLVPFGLGFDRGAPPADADANTGFEGYFRVPLPRTGNLLFIDGWFTRYLDDVVRPYTPADQGRAALTFHGVFREGQLEPQARLEVVRSGAARVALEPEDPFGSIMPAYNQLNFSLQIRILDLQAFLLWNEILPAATFVPVAAAPSPFPRIIYGGRWHFRN